MWSSVSIKAIPYLLIFCLNDLSIGFEKKDGRGVGDPIPTGPWN